MITITHDIDFQRFEIGKNGRFKEIKKGLFRVKKKKKVEFGMCWCRKGGRLCFMGKVIYFNFSQNSTESF